MAEGKDASVLLKKASKVEAAIVMPGEASNPPKMAGDLAVEDAVARQTYARAEQELEKRIKEEGNR